MSFEPVKVGDQLTYKFKQLGVARVTVVNVNDAEENALVRSRDPIRTIYTVLTDACETANLREETEGETWLRGWEPNTELALRASIALGMMNASHQGGPL